MDSAAPLVKVRPVDGHQPGKPRMQRRRRNTRQISRALIAPAMIGLLLSAPAAFASAPSPLSPVAPETLAPLALDQQAFAGPPPRIVMSQPVAGPRIVRGSRWLYCVGFARQMSGIDIRGNAATWWAKARGFYERLTTPEPGAVMVFSRTRRLHAGHVAVVKQLVSPREVRVDHANWGNDGKIYLNTPVYDVSRSNDWSLVKVWNVKLGQLGTHVYRLSGFIAQ